MKSYQRLDNPRKISTESYARNHPVTMLSRTRTQVPPRAQTYTPSEPEPPPPVTSSNLPALPSSTPSGPEPPVASSLTPPQVPPRAQTYTPSEPEPPPLVASSNLRALPSSTPSGPEPEPPVASSLTPPQVPPRTQTYTPSGPEPVASSSLSALPSFTPGELELVASSPTPPPLLASANGYATPNQQSSATDTPSAEGFEIRRAKEPFSVVKTVTGESGSYKLYREELRINTLVACLGVIIGAAALVMSVSKNKWVNNAIIVISLVVIFTISLILVTQLSTSGWTHGVPGGFVFSSVLVILGLYFFSDPAPV
jgi:hypothetical protein